MLTRIRHRLAHLLLPPTTRCDRCALTNADQMRIAWARAEVARLREEEAAAWELTGPLRGSRDA